MTTDTTHITKDQSEARKAEVPEIEALKPCPFCGGKCDPEGWIGDKKRSGPACDDCGSAAETVAIWNTRAAELSAQESKPVGALALAIRFHEIYERLAPSFGYETRRETRAFDPVTPNGKLMVAVCSELLAAPVSAQDASPKDGWKLVPIEPTNGMIKALTASWGKTDDVKESVAKWALGSFVEDYKIMLAAAPEPPSNATPYAPPSSPSPHCWP